MPSSQNIPDPEKSPSSSHEAIEGNQEPMQPKFDQAEAKAPANGSDSPIPAAAAAVVDADSFPDGGLQAWLTVAGAFFAVFASFGWINCIGVFQDYYQSHQLSNYSPGTVAWIPSTESFMMFFCGIGAGKLVDYYGPTTPVILGTFLHIFGLMMTSLSKEYYQIFLAQSICSSIGTSCLFYASVAAAGSWFRRRRALAFGIITAGSSLGGVVLPIMVEHLVKEIGFGWAMRTVAFVLLALLIFSIFTIKSRLPPNRKPFHLMEFVLPFKEVEFFLLAISAFLIYFGAFLPFNYIIVQGKAEGMSEHMASYLVPIVNAASTPGRIIPGYLADKYGVFNVFIIFTLVSGVLNLAIWLPGHSNATTIVFAALYGFSSGACLSILPAVIAKISDVRSLGVRTGTLYAFSAVGALVGSPIAGAIISHENGGFSGLKIFAGVTLLGGVVFAVFARASRVGFSVTARI